MALKRPKLKETTHLNGTQLKVAKLKVRSADYADPSDVELIPVGHPDDFNSATETYKELIWVHCEGHCPKCKKKIDRFYPCSEKN